MARQKISEFQSKVIINSLLGNTYVGWTIKSDLVGINEIDGYDSYVVKVDQAVKKRFKNGLVALDVKKVDIAAAIADISKKGYEFFIVEPYLKHDATQERYISMQRGRAGIVTTYTTSGGVDVEEHTDSMQRSLLTEETIEAIASETGFSTEQLRKIRTAFDNLHISLFEINPYVFRESGDVSILDIAIEVDAAAAHLVKEWGAADVRIAGKLSDEEVFVHKMNEESSSSFNLSVLNKDGAVFLLLSGGGASIVIADEIYAAGHGNDIANYGEYSGNPTQHEAYSYTKQVLNLLLRSSSPKKLLFIGGAVANFTDIATTFSGVIDALAERSTELRKAGVKVYVRRGGPREKIGLRNIEKLLRDEDLYGGVYGPEMTIPSAVKELIKGLV